MIDEKYIEQILDRADIVEVIGEFVTLKKKGTRHQACCPLHGEKTPSFMVNPARSDWHCYGCGKGGNVVTFLMEHESMSYPEALRWLAKKYHIEIEEV